MTHDELLAKVIGTSINVAKSFPEIIEEHLSPQRKALRAVVELHIPYGIDKYPELQSYCLECDHLQSEVWPCPTIKAIEKELT